MRKLASIQIIKEISSIPEANLIELVRFEDISWQCISKKGEFSPGDKCLYFEIDSLLPEEDRYEFLRKSSWKENLGKFRLKTVKMRGVLSQGLALPLSKFPELNNTVEKGTDVTEILHIEKYELPEPGISLGGNPNRFIWPITKTDEERIQSNIDYIDLFYGKPYYATVKMDGTSSSFILMKNSESEELEFHVCSRNFSLKDSEENTYWKIARKYNIEERLKKYYESCGVLLSLQGEICGPGIQKNPLGLKELELFIFNVVDTTRNYRFGEQALTSSVVVLSDDSFLNLKTVPFVREPSDTFKYSTVDELLNKVRLNYKDFEFKNSNKPIEGMVFRLSDGSSSFKVINNEFLLKEKD